MRNLAFSVLVAVAFVLPMTARFAQAADVGMVAEVALTPAGDFKAKSEDVKGEAVQNGDTITAENIVVGLKNLKTGMSLRDRHAKEKYLEVDKFPEAVLVKAIGRGGKGKARIRFKGIEKEVSGTYKTNGGFLLAEFPIKLSDYGISNVKYMGLGVDDIVKVHFTVPLKKK
jgi:polyisoprenoid-binding protein YceI